MTVVYIDSLFLLNFIVDYLLLLATAKLAGEVICCLLYTSKLWFSLTVLLVCLFSESISVGLVTALVMGVLTVRLGGQRPETVLHFLKIPLAFLVIGCATIVLRPISEETEALCAFHLLGQFRWGITVGYLQMGLMVFCNAVGAISAMYFLSLNTPVTDLTMALERLHVPRLLVELCLLYTSRWV